MPPTKPKGGKMMSLINYRLRITLNDSRQIVGQLLAFDAHMNLVLADSQEYRKIKSRKAKARAAAAVEAGKAAAEDDEDDDAAMAGAADVVLEQKRTLGLLILRGEHIVSMAIEAPPPADDRMQPTVSISASSSIEGIETLTRLALHLHRVTDAARSWQRCADGTRDGLGRAAHGRRTATHDGQANALRASPHARPSGHACAWRQHARRPPAWLPPTRLPRHARRTAPRLPCGPTRRLPAPPASRVSSCTAVLSPNVTRVSKLTPLLVIPSTHFCRHFSFGMPPRPQ
jgi:small nuclear ribonucleoprotein (snRNP)-like protein